MTEYAPYDDATQPSLHSKAYFRTTLTAPKEKLIPLPRTVTETSGPRFSEADLDGVGVDLTVNNTIVGSRTIVEGRILDEDGRPIRNAMVEMWQANAAGKYPHEVDSRPAPIEKKFVGAGRMLTDDDGKYRFVTVKPGAYPVPNANNWWRPPHIHFSLYGHAFASRMITQMFFPGDPLNDLDGILQAVPDAGARDRLIAKPDASIGEYEHSLGLRFDMVLRGRAETPMVD